MKRRTFVVIAALSVAIAAARPSSLRGQGADELLAQGLRAYQNLEYDAAAGLLRRSLLLAGQRPLTDAERARSLMYLGATELFRGRRDSALVTFRRLILHDPRFRPDQLVFPPDVSNAFDVARRAVPAVAATAAEAQIQLGDELYPVRLHASTFHEIQVLVTTDEGRLVRQLYLGPIADSLDVRWDGLDSAGTGPAVGAFLLVVVSRNAQGQPVRRVQLPLETRAAVPDTLPHPLAPTAAQLRPERQPPGPAWRALVGGIVAGGAVAVLPTVVTGDAKGSEARFVVAGAISLTGVVAFVAQRPGRALDANAAANRALRETWQRQVQTLSEENARRRRDVRLRITPGRASRIDREAR